MRRLVKLIVGVSVIGLLSGCTIVSGAPTSTPTAALAPAATLSVQPSATPPSVTVISPTPRLATPELEATPGDAFCSDSQVQQAIEELIAAVKTQDGAALAKVTDPVDGLDIFYRLANPPVHLTVDEIPGVFTSTFPYTWGDQAGSGLPVEGTFTERILPGLVDVFEREYTTACQDLATGVGTGPTTALVDWPMEFEGLPFVSLFRAPGVGDNELDWRTWAVGFTVVNGQPRVRVLAQYVWEI